MSSPAKREWIKHEYEAKRWQIKTRDPTKEIVYRNQAEAAQDIFQAFICENKVAVTLIALPQAGKTGTFLEVAYRMCTFNDDMRAIDPDNLLIITGMSDREWRWQTSGDMLTPFQQRVKHRGQFESVPTLLATLHDSLIIIDECHIAAEKEQSMSAMLRAAKLLDIDELRRRRIFLLEVSATPGATLYDTQNWGQENHAIVILKESPIYVGFRDFIAEKRLHESLDLTKAEEVEKLMTFIETHFPDPRYHIIRLSGRKTITVASQHIRGLANTRGWLVHNHNANERMWDLDHIMTTPPRYHSIILIKEFWRAGKRLCDNFVGIVHEPKTQVEDTNVTSQGLVGRLCGNDKRKGAGAPHAFCNTTLIQDYLSWIDAKGDYSSVLRYKSKNLNAKKGVITSKESFVHHTNVEGLEFTEEDETSKSSPTDPDTYRIYDDIHVVQNVLHILGYNFVRPTENNGFFEASLRQAARVLSLEETVQYVPKARGASGGGTSSRRYYPCYIDIKDKSTLRFVVIIEEITDKVKNEELKSQLIKVDKEYPSIPYQSNNNTNTQQVQNRVLMPSSREQTQLPIKKGL